jgi:hypothetical protein
MRGLLPIVLSFAALLAMTGCGGVGGGDLDGSLPDSTVEDGPSTTQKDAGPDVPLVDTGPGPGTDAPVDSGSDSCVPVGGDGAVTIKCGPAQVLGPTDKSCSSSSTTASAFEIMDLSADASFDLVLVNESCTDMAYGTFTQDDPLSVTGYTDSVWHVQNHADKSLVGGFILEANKSYQISVQ